MTTVRIHRHQGGFVTIANSTMRDERLSFRARGLLAYLLSHEDGFVTSIKQITEISKEGREAIAAALREIEVAGYLFRPRQQNEKGQWHTYWDLHEVPPEADPQLSVDPEPIPGNSAFGASGTKEKTKEKNPPTPPDFDEFWEACPRKTGKKAASAAYRRALKVMNAEELLQGMKLFAKGRAGEDQKFTCHPATWLNQERWNDEPLNGNGMKISTRTVLRETMGPGGQIITEPSIEEFIAPEDRPPKPPGHACWVEADQCWEVFI